MNWPRTNNRNAPQILLTINILLRISQERKMKILCVSFKPAKSLNVGIGVKIYFIVYEHLQLATLKGEEGEKTEHWQQGVTLLLDTSTPSGGETQK